MEITPTAIAAVKLIQPRVWEDGRGFFFEAWREDAFHAAGIEERFRQLNHSRSVQDTLRGLHFQVTHTQGKLVRVLAGEIWDVAVDLRPGSDSYRRWVGMRLSAENRRQIYLPPGFAHGFCVLSAVAEVEYFTTDVYDPAGERSLLWNDPAIGIEWPVAEPLLSEKDRAAPRLAELETELEVFRQYL